MKDNRAGVGSLEAQSPHSWWGDTPAVLQAPLSDPQEEDGFFLCCFPPMIRLAVRGIPWRLKGLQDRAGLAWGGGRCPRSAIPLLPQTLKLSPLSCFSHTSLLGTALGLNSGF